MFPEELYYTFSCFTGGFIFAVSYKDHDDQSKALLNRASQTFDLAYRRYQDLKKAEAQAREAQIEAALERVRAASMAMHSSKGLLEVAAVLRDQFALLGQENLESCIVGLYEKGSDTYTAHYSFNIPDRPEEGPVHDVVLVPWRETAWSRKVISNVDKGIKEFTIHSSGKMLKEWYGILERKAPKTVEYDSSGELIVPDELYYTFSCFTGGFIFAISYKDHDDQSKALLKRASQTFDLAYRRYQDLKKAEAQAREAQIETALERVRAASMAMHESSEMHTVITAMYEQFRDLGIAMDAAMIVERLKHTRDWYMWLAVPSADFDGYSRVQRVHVPYQRSAVFSRLDKAMNEGRSSLVETLSKRQKNVMFEHYFSKSNHKDVPQKRKDYILNGPGLSRSVAINENAVIQCFRYNNEAFSEADNDVIQRMARVFEQAYTRFLDLQKAESQAREAQIESALDKVRSEMMAMHHSNQLRDVIASVFTQLQVLGFAAPACAIITYDEDHAAEHWFSGFSQEIYPQSYTIPRIDKFTYNTDLIDAWLNGVEYLTIAMEGQMKVDYGTWMMANTNFADLPEEFTKECLSPEILVLNDAFNKYGMLEVLGREELSERDAEILKRFSKVFEQTYTRFLDLQKAEAQAREAQIETSLERVRAASMAMHRSDELIQVIDIVFNQLKTLDIDLDACYIDIFKEGSWDLHLWVGTGSDTYSDQVHIPYINHPLFSRSKQARINGEEFYVLKFDRKTKERIVKHLASHMVVPKHRLNLISKGKSLNMSAAVTKYATLAVYNYKDKIYSDHENNVIKRIAAVFDQAYRRFLDLKKAEAQAREAQIEASLERVRSRSHRHAQFRRVAGSHLRRIRRIEITGNRDGCLMDPGLRRYKGYPYVGGQPPPQLCSAGAHTLQTECDPRQNV